MKKIVKRTSSLLACLLLLVTLLPQVPVWAESVIAEGTCGEDAYWTLDAAGKLTVSGSGSMYDYSLDVWGDGSVDTPWYAHSSLITNVVIQNGVTGIGEYAFYDCRNLSSITIADSLTRIGNRAFEGCSSLTSINIPESVTSIGERTFSGCSSLTSINIPEGVTSIVNSAFSGCSSLTSVTIPDSVTRIGASAFEFCSSLTSIAIPEGVTGIANDTFYSCENLVTVTIPESVTSIGEWAFRNCSSLPTITIPKSVTEIHNQAFCGCSSLTAITFLGSAPSFGENVFGNVTATAHYPCGDATWTEDVAKNYGGTIAWEAAHTYENNFCTNCGKAAILYSGTCGEDAYWTLDAAGKLTIYGTGQMERFTDTTYVPWHEYRSMITEAVIEDGIGNVGDFSFWDCTNLTSVTIPDSVTDIGAATFCGCTALCSVTLPQNLTCINDEAFSGCDSLAAIAIPNGVTAIGEYAFSYCKSLAEITLGESLQTIGEGAFVRCPVTAVTIPASVTKLGSCAFDRCGSLSSITFLGSAPAFVSNCFAEVTATAYYPCGDETWTEDVKQSYGGTITWEGSHTYEAGICTVCGAADPDYVNPLTAPTISLKYPTVSFEDVILMNVYFSAENLQDVVQMGLVTYSEKVTEVSVETAGKVIPGYTWSEADGFYYVTTAGIAPKDIGNTLYFAIYYKLTDGTYGYTKLAGYSPKTYALGQLKTGSPEMKALVVAMLNYGAAAQTYFGYNTDALMNAGLTADQQALVEAYSDEMIAAVTQASGDKLGEFVDDKQYTKRYPTISFEGAFCINYYFQPTQPVSGDVTMYIWSLEDYEAAEVLTKENATKAVTMELTATGEYLAAVDGIAAKDLDKATYVTFCYSDGTTDHCGGVLGYTIGLYCKSQASQTSALADLAKACAVYGYYAGQMFK